MEDCRGLSCAGSCERTGEALLVPCAACGDLHDRFMDPYLCPACLRAAEHGGA